MKPFRAVQAIIGSNSQKRDIVGSCFRLWASNFYITANHCVDDLTPEQIQIVNYTNDNDFQCITKYQHPTSDIAILEVHGDIPLAFEKFSIYEKDFEYERQVHCFGFNVGNDKTGSPCRVIGGIIQRDFVYSDKKYKSLALELSVSIPKGTSGGPAFFADRNDTVIGMAIGSIQSEVIVSNIEEYQEQDLKFRERISEITHYGVILRLYPLKEWIGSIISKN